VILSLVLTLAQAGGGSSGFGGGGGGGGGGSGGGGGGGFGGGGGSGGGGGFVFFALIVFVFIVVAAVSAVGAARVRRRRRERVQQVMLAAAEAAQDDVAFDADRVTDEASQLFTDIQLAWDARDRPRLRELIGGDLLVEWERRLDDFDSRGWHSRVRVVRDPTVEYVGLVNRAADEEDRAVVRLSAPLMSWVEMPNGQRIYKTGEDDATIAFAEYWTLAKSDGHWTLVSIEQDAEGAHHLTDAIVASPWSDDRLHDEALVEQAVADRVPEGFSAADAATFAFAGTAREEALDLSLADARFLPDVLEAAVRRAAAAWAEAVDGEDAPLEHVASREAIDALLYGSDAQRRTRLVVRGPRIERVVIERVDAQAQPARMTVTMDVRGRRYREDRDTAAVVSGSRDREASFQEHWELALDGPDDAPWRVVGVNSR
jgi:predicted lipid-binding transport protein (Tim44 family)